MPQPPDQLPESIVLGQFSGITNTASRHRLKQDELEQALNVDIDDRGQVRRRRGVTRKIAGNFHSVKRIGGRVYGVKDGELGWIDPGYVFHGYGTQVGPHPVSYTAVASTIYFSSETTNGKIVDDVVQPWGTQDNGTWVSPVITPTATLGALFGKLLSAPPVASLIAGFKGRILMAAGPYLWYTELWLYDYIDRASNFFQFEEDITMVFPVDDGVYIGTKNNLWFLRGAISGGMPRSNILEVGVLRGSEVDVPLTDVHPDARNGPKAENMGVVFMTHRGICAAFDGGEVYDLTHGRVEFPAAEAAAALYREDSGVSSYVAVTNSAGSPAANARIGDFVDAEIVRRGG